MKDASEKQIADPVWAKNFNITDDEESFDWDAFLDGEPPEESDEANQVA